MTRGIITRTLAGIAALLSIAPARAQETPKLPTLEEAVKGYTKVIPADASPQSMYTLYVKPDSRDILAALPRDYEKQVLLLGNATTGGTAAAGIQGDTHLVRWKRYGQRLALLKPQVKTRTTGDADAVRAAEQLFTDFSLFDVPIVAEGEGGAPVIALDDLLIDRSTLFYAWSPGGLETRVATIKKLKVFPNNISIAIEMPWRMDGQPDVLNNQTHGQLMTISYSLSLLPDPADYTPREADQRVGYFISSFYDLNRVGDPSTARTRYIKRWKLEKADPKLALSPPREPIVFYIDHKTPVRYRRWVREGVLEWNKAFEEVGIVNAVECYQQDATTGAHMDKDPENIRFNFVVWNSNDIAFAIGPCRVDPRNGRILDADVVMNDGWLRVAADGYRKYLASAMIEGLDRETLDWLAARPQWDPRVRCADPALRGDGAAPISAPGAADPSRLLAHGAACGHADCRALDLAVARWSLVDLDPAAFGTRRLADPLDGVPEEFVGQQVKDVVMHEVGHVLGLRHNFKASTIYSQAQINSAEWRDAGKPITGSVMDYNPINFNTDESRVQGPYYMTTLGPYDIWAIRYGYAPESELEGILKEATKPEHIFATDEDLYGPDPAVRTRDLGANVLDSVDGDMALVQRLRGRILERALKKGESYERAREAYFTLLGMQGRSISTLGRYIGGVTQRRDRVGDSDREPTEPVAAADQRRALDQLDRYVFRDEAFGLSPGLLAKMSFDRWFDQEFIPQDLPDPQLDVHDVVLGVQASALTLVLNPAKLRRIYDSEFRIPAEQDALTVAELFGTLQDAVWRELAGPAVKTAHSARKPFISSLRRNLQREHLDRMIDLTLPGGMEGAVARSVGTLASGQLRQLDERIEKVLGQSRARLDPYTAAHLDDARSRIRRALEAMYVYK